LSAALNEGSPEVEITSSEPQHDRGDHLSRQQLGDVAIGDRITVTGADGSSRDYRVTGRKVVDPHLAEGDSVAPTGGTVSTITCWPLDAVTNSLRLIIQATRVDQPKVPQRSAEQKL
jgi:sortase (surface protein transpeptidase)